MAAHSMSDSDPDDPPPKRIKLSPKKGSKSSSKSAAKSKFAPGPDDEVFIVKVPSSVTTNRLYNIEIPSKAKKCVKVGEQTFETLPVESSSGFTVIYPDDSLSPPLTSIQCRGTLKLGEHVEVPAVPDIEVPPPYLVPKPKLRRDRHPIYGIGNKRSKKLKAHR